MSATAARAAAVATVAATSASSAATHAMIMAVAVAVSAAPRPAATASAAAARVAAMAAAVAAVECAYAAFCEASSLADAVCNGWHHHPATTTSLTAVLHYAGDAGDGYTREAATHDILRCARGRTVVSYCYYVQIQIPHCLDEVFESPELLLPVEEMGELAAQLYATLIVEEDEVLELVAAKDELPSDSTLRRLLVGDAEVEAEVAAAATVPVVLVPSQVALRSGTSAHCNGHQGTSAASEATGIAALASAFVGQLLNGAVDCRRAGVDAEVARIFLTAKLGDVRGNGPGVVGDDGDGDSAGDCGAGSNGNRRDPQHERRGVNLLDPQPSALDVLLYGCR